MTVRWWILAGCLVACSGKNETSTGSSASTATNETEVGTIDGECALDVRVGRFSVDETEDYAVVDGKVNDAVVPTDVLTLLYASGDCEVLRRENPFCDPACGSSETCDLSGNCVPYPLGVSVGDVQLTGLVSPVTMSPVEPGNAYFDTSLPNPPWQAGEALHLSASGAAEGFSMDAIAPEALVLASTDWTLVPGEAFVVQWQAPSSNSASDVRLELRIDQHGSTPAKLVCKFADVGEGTVDAETLSVLIDNGLTGFPAGELHRRSVDHTDADTGCVEFLARSTRTAFVEVAGYTPCRQDTDCPDGETCNEALERCEPEAP